MRPTALFVYSLSYDAQLLLFDNTAMGHELLFDQLLWSVKKHTHITIPNRAVWGVQLGSMGSQIQLVLTEQNLEGTASLRPDFIVENLSTAVR